MLNETLSDECEEKLSSSEFDVFQKNNQISTLDK